MIKKIALTYLGWILCVAFLLLGSLFTYNQYSQQNQLFEKHVLVRTMQQLQKAALKRDNLNILRSGAIQGIVVFDQQNNVLESTSDTVKSITYNADWRNGGWHNPDNFNQYEIYVSGNQQGRLYLFLIDEDLINVSFWGSLWDGFVLSFWLSLLTGLAFAFFVINQRVPLRELYKQLSNYYSQQHKDISNLYVHTENLNRSHDYHLEHLRSLNEDIANVTELSKDNTEKTMKANRISDEISHSTSTGTITVQSLNESMENISSSMEKTTVIIKTIDEIAFQTNILAVNASVEAARAGQAGSGFAVVADEVRRLAMRTTDAARETSEILDQSKKLVSGGLLVTEQVSNVFNQINTKTVEVFKILGQLANTVEDQQHKLSSIRNKINDATRFGTDSDIALSEINMLLQTDIDHYSHYSNIINELTDQITFSFDEIKAYKDQLNEYKLIAENWTSDQVNTAKNLVGLKSKTTNSAPRISQKRNTSNDAITEETNFDQDNPNSDIVDNFYDFDDSDQTGNSDEQEKKDLNLDSDSDSEPEKKKKGKSAAKDDFDEFEGF
jgi:hypothetical protein